MSQTPTHHAEPIPDDVTGRVHTNRPIQKIKVHRSVGKVPFTVKCYLRICDRFFDLLSYVTTPALVVLPVVVKFVALRLQSDRWMWRVSTLMQHMVHGSSLCMRDALMIRAS